MCRRRSFRIWAVVWAVLQFALPAVASYGDAVLERSGVVAAQIHVEASTTKDCARVHPAECGLCQVLSRTGATVRGPELPAIIAALAPALPGHVALAGRRSAERSPLPRAPPVG